MTATINEWLAAFPMKDARAKMEALEERRAALEAEIARLSRLIEDAAGIAGAYVPATPNGNGHDGPRGMDAVEAVMRGRSGVWTRRDINRELVSKGWLADGEKGRRTLGSIMHRMVNARRVERLAPGRYKLPAGEQQEVLAA